MTHYSSTQKRLAAKFLDLLVVIFLGLAWKGGPGSILGFLYSMTADSLPMKRFHNQSLGKKIMGIEVKPDRGSMGLKLSIIRNAPVGLVTFLMIIPFWGWLLSLIVGIPLGLIELSLMIRADRHQRLGDVMAETTVIQSLRSNELPNMPKTSGQSRDHEPKVL